MKTNKKITANIIFQRIVFSVLVFLAIFLQGLFFANIIMWRSAPNRGWRTIAELGPTIVGVTSPLGEKAGLRIGDKILTLNGKTYETYDELIKLTNEKVDHVNVYTIERDGQTFTVSVINQKLGLKRVIIQSGFFWVLGVIFLGIGIVVFLMKPYHEESWAFLTMTLIMGIFMTYSAPSYHYKPHWLQSILVLLVPFFPASIMHLGAVFPQKRSFLAQRKWSVFVPYIFSLILAVLAISFAFNFRDIPVFLLNIIYLYILASLILFLGSTIYSYMKTTSAAVRLQSLVIFLGITVAMFFPLADTLANLFFTVSIFPNTIFFYLLFLIFFPLSIGYAIVRHDLFEIDMIIRRTYGYVLTTGSIAGMYGLFVLLSNVAFGRYEVTKSPMFPLVFILAVVLLFNPIRNRAQKIIDRVFYRLEYDYQDIIQKISETMRSLLNLDQIGKSIMDTTLGAMFIDSGCVMLLNQENKAYECLISAGEREIRRSQTELERTLPSGEKPVIYEPGINDKATLQAESSETLENNVIDSRSLNLMLSTDEPFIQKIAERKKEVTVYDIQADPFFEDQRASCRDAFDQLQATLIVPLIYEDRLTGLISLGEKKSGKFYRREDINLLNTLANQGAVAIENARMIEEVIEKERMEEELSIARDLQTSMLPAECPTIEGFEIAAYSLSAMEVGGDFYDFIDMGKNKTGMVIGDVTGKSVSGALVMSASRSVFRMLSEEQMSVGEIMIRANRRTKKDIKTGMFVALLYAVLNAEDRTLSMCSAGQTQPVHWSSETGKAILVETKGDTFPLGILEDVGYQETRLHLSPGDKVVLYTDGIVEAMDEKEKMFGFDRLIEVVQEARSMTADLVLKEILDRVNAFAGGAAQHDDLTVIVISAVG
ncbi:SpoIIE family protein phosphatase [Thermodesulfobacteriota bacterium]